jgi:hypothetical protein
MRSSSSKGKRSGYFRVVNAALGSEMAFHRTRTANAAFGSVWFGVRKVHEPNVPKSIYGRKR